MLSVNHVSFFISFCQQSCNEFPTMKYVWMTEYQASNIAVEDTENSTLIEPWINIDLIQRWYVTLIQRHFSTSIKLSNPTKIQRLFNVDMWCWSNVIFQHPFNFQIQLKFNVFSTLMVNVVSTLKQRWCACWDIAEILLKVALNTIKQINHRIY